jgi:hypothetical protein
LSKFNIIGLFNDVFGASDSTHLSKPTHIWAKYKVEYIREIANINNCKSDNIFYIDDTQENIKYAIDSGYPNSILLPGIGTNSIILTGILDKIYRDNNKIIKIS